MKLADLKIGTRLGASFGLLLILMTLLTAVGMWLLQDFRSKNDYLLDDAIAKERLATEWYSLTALNGARGLLVLVSTNAKEQAAIDLEMKETSANVSHIVKQLEQTVAHPTAKAALVNALEKRTAYVQLRDAVLRAKENGDHAALVDAPSKLRIAQRDYQTSIGQLVQFQKQKSEMLAADVEELTNKGLAVLGGLWLAAIVAAVASTILTTRSITQPLQHAIDVARAVAQGQLHQRQEACSRDETGQLLGALNQMTIDLARIVSAVHDSSAAITTASTEIADGNQELSVRTEQQAGSLEETASSIEELTATVKQNADNARQADQLARAASDVAIKGGAVVAQVVTTMDSISASAKKITDIISVIDGIAFQTNILALNAAVEAARAGEQGRGFAVVASEVRNLAQRSASAAKEIKSLIEVSVNDVAAGTALVGRAGATMEEIVSSVGRVTEMMLNISLATSEQEAGIGQINQAIGQMDATTQQNASLVEQASAASQALRDQARQMEDVVSVFHLEERPVMLVAPRAAVKRIGRETTSAVR